jgi:hypothetical protein
LKLVGVLILVKPSHPPNDLFLSSLMRLKCILNQKFNQIDLSRQDRDPAKVGPGPQEHGAWAPLRQGFWGN